MNNWTKTTFNGTIITSEFLNKLQEFIYARAPKLVPYDERIQPVPLDISYHSLYLDDRGILLGEMFELMVGDTIVGNQSGNLARVTGYVNHHISISGLGKRLYFGSENASVDVPEQDE